MTKVVAIFSMHLQKLSNVRRRGANIVQRMPLFYSIKQEANEVQKAFSELTYNCSVIKKVCILLDFVLQKIKNQNCCCKNVRIESFE